MRNFFKPFFPAVGQDNNFDILRVFAAALAILSHGWSLTNSDDEPILVLSRASLNGGGLGIWIFFFISGYQISEIF